MEAVYSLKKENPKNKANIVSKLFFIWMLKLCYKGTRKTLEVIDLYKTLPWDQSEGLTDNLEKNWNEELRDSKLTLKKTPSLLRAIVKTFFWNYMIYGILLFIQMMLIRSFQPYVLAYFINLFSGDIANNQNEMFIFGAVLVLQSLLMVTSLHHIEFGQASVGMRVRISVSSLIFRKMLRLSKKSLGETAAGQVVNLLSNDVNRFDFVTLALHYLWIAPLQIVLVTYLIWTEMGISTLAGVLFILCLTLPLQGKSSILQLLLGELPPTTGSIRVGGTISYSSQEPWLFGSTVRNNILFGQSYDRTRYRKIVKVCALEKDFQQFPQGDRTVVGEKGVSLSGGQRARVNLARAVYRQADIYLLDDPLSAVDTHVGRHLFDECILRYLGGKTRILVTHQLQYLKQADYIAVINEGRIEAGGTFNELINSDVDFTKLLVSENEEIEVAEVNKGRDRAESIISHKSIASEQSDVIEKVENMEEMSSSDTSPFKDYIKAAGHCCTIFGVVTLLLIAQLCCNGADLWVTLWTEQEAIRASNETYVTNSTNGWLDTFTDTLTHGDQIVHLIKSEVFIYMYLGIIILAISLTLSRSFAFFKTAMTASKNLHNQMFHSLLQAPMRFFDTNPSGRVLNRFSKDMGAIDEFLPRVLIDAIQILLVMTGILVMVVIANYYMLIAIVIIGFLFFKVRGWYLATARDVKHLEGMTKSSVFSHLNSCFNGITTIRASRAEAVLMKEFDLHQDTHTSAWFLTISARVAFGLWLDLLSVTFIAIVIFSFILLTYYSYVSGSFVGLAISQSLILSGMLQYGMRQTAEVVNQLTSVERVMQYTRLDNEHKNTNAIESVKENWPNGGFIEFRELNLRYSDSDPPVLRNLNFIITPGNKIGIVGRTGAGKSSLISALFRLAPTEGAIVIDGVNTNTIPLDQLRKCISIIPQEPVLFSATLRYNLDPFQEFDDHKLWDVLEQVELKDSVRDLDIIVSEGGSNFSLGQRQLVCLARAILRNNKILVLDEATANVDPRTDALIQHTIRKRFQNCTVLTIAHRLNTIMDCDCVLVMNAGRMVEFDHPHVLLQDEDGYFSKMVAETGPAMAQQLKQTADESYHSNVI